MKLSSMTNSSQTGATTRDWDSHRNPQHKNLLFKFNVFFQMPPSIVSILPLPTEESYELPSGKHRLIKRTCLTTVNEKTDACTKADGSSDLPADSLCSGSHVPQCMCHCSSCYSNKETRSQEAQNKGAQATESNLA